MSICVIRRLVVLAAVFWGAVAFGEPTLSKGHRILLQRGLVLQGMVTKDDVFHLDTYKAAGFTSLCWIWDSNIQWLGPAPGFPWARWIGGPDRMPSGDESAYAENLVALQLSDEQDLNDPAVRASMASWYEQIRPQYPDTILYCNSYGGQLTNPSLDDFIRTSRPDMLSFDTYPFGPQGPAGGSPTNLYGDMQRYRKFALANGLPYAMYTQMFHDQITRDVSESQMRLNYFAGLAFGYTCFNAFTYNTGASRLFNSPGGDSHPTPAYAWLTETHRRVRLLGRAMTRLVNTDVRFINGQYRDGTSGAVITNPTPIDVLNWQYAVNDPYLRGWVVTNVGTKNDGLKGDVWLAWFKPLDESFDGAAHTGEIYMMVVNGLTDRDGSAADCRQSIKLNFLFSSGITSVDRVSQVDGRIETVECALLPNTGGRRQLSLELDGGTGELFKFHTGAVFVGATPPDLDDDADVDVADFERFQGCFAGPQQSAAIGCKTADFDHDGDVDVSDFGVFQRCMSGADQRPDVNCAF